MHGRRHRRIVVKCRDAKHDMRLIRTLGDDVRSAQGTEPSHPTGRRFEGRKFFRACNQMKMLPRNARGGCVRCCMSLAAGLTVAMTDRCVETVDLIT